MNIRTLSLQIIPSPESNDHQVRIFLDGKDWLNELGVDPSDFFKQNFSDDNNKLWVGRCNCGVDGCSNTYVKVQRQRHEVIWTTLENKEITFYADRYDKEIERAKNDHSWEDVQRRAERLVSDLFKGTTIEDHVFQWASARVEEKKIVLSYSKNGFQQLYDFRWDGKSSEDAMLQAEKYYSNIKNK